jgi:hypothetical protein
MAELFYSKIVNDYGKAILCFAFVGLLYKIYAIGLQILGYIAWVQMMLNHVLRNSNCIYIRLS